MIVPSQGDVVLYMLTNGDASYVTRRLDDAMVDYPRPQAGQTFPMIIVSVQDDRVSGKVILEGTDMFAQEVPQARDNCPPAARHGSWFARPRLS